MDVHMQTCRRCGLCCKGQFVRVPRYEHSDIGPEHLEQIRRSEGGDAAKAYFEENSMPQGARCVWLQDNADGSTTCTAYTRRSATCRDFNNDGNCQYWMQAFGVY